MLRRALKSQIAGPEDILVLSLPNSRHPILKIHNEVHKNQEACMYQHDWNLNITIEIEQYGIKLFKEINVAKISTPEWQEWRTKNKQGSYENNNWLLCWNRSIMWNGKWISKLPAKVASYTFQSRAQQNFEVKLKQPPKQLRQTWSAGHEI